MSHGQFIRSICLMPSRVPLENDILLNKINDDKNLLADSYEIGYWLASEYTNMRIVVVENDKI
ncbi:159_t:CDS:2 [Ambispora gerdemannii]|uniref:159_t:CDS:1 n=1 Tax=Ambispora gerdemannii TaxID=144530 RepID=A0A9N9FYX0_9GLOM|nr:159_t:CDS:2 [Ambispora gerdemannii]